MTYTLGLDIGITSVGWALLDFENERILDLGVRIFEGCETPKDGSSLAAPYREARSARRRLRRKARRMKDIRTLFVDRGLLTSNQMQNLFTKRLFTEELFAEPRFATPWELRTLALDHLLPPLEFARVLLHMAKHRGFKSNRIASPPDEKNAKAKEDGVANASIKANNQLLKEGGYRTAGEMIWKDERFREHKRNKAGDYTNTVARSDLENEISAIFTAQRGLGNPFADEDLEKNYLEIFSRQLPFASGDMIEKLTGNCTFEPGCKRAPRAAWTSERFILLSEINKLRVRINGQRHDLTKDEVDTIVQLAYGKTKVTYKQIRAALDPNNEWAFEDLTSNRKNPDKDPEEKTFIELRAFHQFKKIISSSLGKEFCEDLLSRTPEILDTLASALTFRKTDDDIRNYLRETQISPDIIEAVLPLNFTGVLRLSLKAMNNILPHMEMGARYDQACALAGYDHSNPNSDTQKSALLPVLDVEEIRNPVVFRALTQMRKVVNAIIRKYGAPHEIHVELSRDLAKSREERNKIKRRQDENRNDKESQSRSYHETFGKSPNSTELLKFRLWREQGGRCALSGKYIDPELAFGGSDRSYVEIDHIIPYSLSFDDGYNNKVLVFGSENRNKKNRTPFQYLGANEGRWAEFVAWVDTTYKGNKRKAENLKRRDFGEDEASEMKDRNLSDTREITKYAANWLERSLVFSDTKVDNAKRVIRINGRMTDKLRRGWGLAHLKDREKDDLHHALDACVVAAATQAMVFRITNYYSKRERMELLNHTVPEGEKTRFPEPWFGFRKEVEARLSQENPAEKIVEAGLSKYTEDDLTKVKPIFISRAPVRKADGPAHKETVQSAKLLNEGKRVIKTPLSKLNLASLENMVGKTRDKRLYEDLKARLEKFDDKPVKAFSEEFRKGRNDGRPGPLVRSIKIWEAGTAGVLVNGGIAKNAEIVRVDVYHKGKHFFLIPYYRDDIAMGRVKDKAITVGKDESQWTVVDSSYEFRFSLFKNDLIRVVGKNSKEHFVYYLTTDRSTGLIKIMAHDGSEPYRIAVNTARLFEKYEVDVLGQYHRIKREKPHHELA